jgi:hypothetical protein
MDLVRCGMLLVLFGYGSLMVCSEDVRWRFLASIIIGR